MQASGHGYTVGANLSRSDQLVYSLSGNHNAGQLQPHFSVISTSQNGGNYYMSTPQHSSYQGQAGQMIQSGSQHGISDVSGHLQQQSGFDDPVDLSSGKIVNGLIKQERQHATDDHQRHMYNRHNGIHVGIPNGQGKFGVFNFSVLEAELSCHHICIHCDTAVTGRISETV